MKERWLQNPSEEASSVLKCVQKAKALRQSQKVKLSTTLEEDHNKGLPFKIASNWVLVSLDDLASKIHYGYTAPAVFEDTHIKLLRITDIQDNKVNWDNVPGCLIDDHTTPSYLLHRGDLLVARTGGTIGKTFLVKELPQPTVFASYLIRIVPNECVNPDFLKLFADSLMYWNQLYERSKGAGQPNVNATSLKALKIPLPPLPEQQRIVDILDKAFDGIATAKANAEKNLQNARALFESHLQSVFTRRGEGWVEKQLGDVCELFQGLCINAKTKHLLVERSSLPLLRIRDLRENSAEQFVSENGWPKNAHVTESDIIYTRTGQIGLVFRGRVGILHNNCFKIIPKPILNNDYLFWWLQNPAFRARITNLASKAAQPDITHLLFKAQPILLPPRAYQDKAIALINDMHQETQRLESIYQRKLEALDELKKSLLHQAFSGQL